MLDECSCVELCLLLFYYDDVIDGELLFCLGVVVVLVGVL